MAVQFAPFEPLPDLVLGLVGPIGVDLGYISQALSDSLVSYNYESEHIQLTQLMQELVSDKKIDSSNVALSYSSKIDYANDLRRKYKANDILAAIAVGAIKNRRSQIIQLDGRKQCGRAFIIRQFKTPEEIRLMRSVYGKNFIQISIYGSQKKREEFLISRMKLKSKAPEPMRCPATVQGI